MNSLTEQSHGNRKRTDCPSRRTPLFREAAAGQRDALRTALEGLDEADVDTALGAGSSQAGDEPYGRGVIRRDRFQEVAAAKWVGGRACPLHGHSASAVLLRVLSGELVEERFVPAGDGGYRYEVTTLRAGDESWLPAGTFHRIACVRDASTVHAFGPPPLDPVAPVPEELRPALRRAKERAASFAFTPAGARPSLEDVVRTHAQAWAEREEQQTLDGLVRVAPTTLADWRSTGLLAAPVPADLGGWGTSLAEAAAAIRLLARTAPATALALAMPLGNAATAAIPDTAVPQGDRAALAAGRRWVARQTLAGKILAVANSEPGAGGELSQTRTVATPGGDNVFRLTGCKSFATIGPDADFFLCAARRAGGGARDVIDGFFVARDAAGVSLDDRWDPLGMRATASVGLTLDAAPAAAVMGYPGCLEGVNARHWSTVLFAAVFVGVAEGAIAAAADGLGDAGARSCYARASLSDCALDAEAAAGLLEAVAANEQWPLPPAARERTVRAKTFAAKVAVETATRAAMLGGGRAYRAGHVVSRLLHDALAGPLLRPPLPKAMDAIADQLLGRPDAPPVQPAGQSPRGR